MDFMVIVTEKDGSETIYNDEETLAWAMATPFINSARPRRGWWQALWAFFGGR